MCPDTSEAGLDMVADILDAEHTEGKLASGVSRDELRGPTPPQLLQSG